MSHRLKVLATSSFILLFVIGVAFYATNDFFRTGDSSSDVQKNLNELAQVAIENHSSENLITELQPATGSEAFLLDSVIDPIEPPAFEAENPISKIFSYELSLADGISKMASDGLWSYDQMMKNMALWENLCSKGLSDSSAIIHSFSDIQSAYSKIDLLCEDFSSRIAEIDDFIEVEIDESAAGFGERANLESSLKSLGPDSASRQAISELSSALDNSNYAQVVEIIWFLGIYKFDNVSEEFRIYTNRPSVETIFSVAASIYCNYIGGCYGQHPVTLNLCLQFDDLPCSRAPRDVFDSINQILTGHEIDTFNQMNSSLIRLINRYRRNEL